MSNEIKSDINNIASCGLYCGACRKENVPDAA